MELDFNQSNFGPAHGRPLRDMKPFFFFSFAAHGFFLAAFIVLGTLLSKPRMSYYAVDLMSSLPAGGGISPGSEAAPITAATPKGVSAPKVSAPKPAAEEEIPADDTIRLLDKLKKKRLALARSQPAETPAPDVPAPPNQGSGGVGLAGSGSGVVADAGPGFPYPWYTRAIVDRLKGQWNPPHDYAPDTVCEVTFNINRAGQVSGLRISKRSGDAVFDQIGLRAVLYAGSFPSLPGGYLDDTLTVHMKFFGKRL
jgi:TonB family protein